MSQLLTEKKTSLPARGHQRDVFAALCWHDLKHDVLTDYRHPAMQGTETHRQIVDYLHF